MQTPRNRSMQKFPHVFLILLLLVLLGSILTYLIPSGAFERAVDPVTGQNLVVPGSYHHVEKTPVGPWLIPAKFYETLISANVARLIFFIFIIGGSFEIVMESGCVSALCGKTISIFKNKGILIIPVFITLFSIFGFAMGLSTASIIFVPIGIAIARALGMDSMIGMAMVMIGTNVGFTAGIFNPFSVGIAQSIAELPLFSGAWIRWLLLAVLLVSTSIYLVFYARKMGINEVVLSDRQELWEAAQKATGKETLTLRQTLVLIDFILMLCAVTYGVSKLGWDVSQIAIAFLIMGVLAGILSGIGMNKTCDTFVAGCRKMMKGALIIGIAATLRTVLFEGNILDTIANALIGVVYHFPSWAQLLGMFYANAAIDPIITSGSAHAAVVMPVMVPMADALSISRQSAVLAFQLGDGIVNLISPISTTLTSCLAVSGLSYCKWLKLYLPLVGLHMIIGTIFIIFAAAIGY